MYNPQVSPVSSGLHALDRSSHGLLIHLQGDQTKKSWRGENSSLGRGGPTATRTACTDTNVEGRIRYSMGDIISRPTRLIGD